MIRIQSAWPLGRLEKSEDFLSARQKISLRYPPRTDRKTVVIMMSEHGADEQHEEDHSLYVGVRANDAEWAAQRCQLLGFVESRFLNHEVAVEDDSDASKLGNENEYWCNEIGFIKFVGVLHIDEEAVPSGLPEALAMDGMVSVSFVTQVVAGLLKIYEQQLSHCAHKLMELISAIVNHNLVAGPSDYYSDGFHVWDHEGIKRNTPKIIESNEC